MNIAVITLQGMGKPNLPFYWKLEKKLRKQLTKDVNNRVKFFPVNYQAAFQDEQTKMWERALHRYKREIRQRLIRRFLVNYFSDAVTYESDKDNPGGVYQSVHFVIKDELERAFEFAGNDGHLVVISHSLGCQVFSDYVWDLQHSFSGKKTGIWQYSELPGQEFLKLKNFRYWFSCGCNIPLFVSGYKKIEAIDKPSETFEWYNYFDKSDVLGWPLKMLSKTGENGAQSGYNEIVNKDIQLNTGLWLFSHVRYWKRRNFNKRVAQKINQL